MREDMFVGGRDTATCLFSPPGRLSSGFFFGRGLCCGVVCLRTARKHPSKYESTKTLVVVKHMCVHPVLLCSAVPPFAFPPFGKHGQPAQRGLAPGCPFSP